MPGGDHFNILRPLTRHLTAHIAPDTESECEIEFNVDGLAAAMSARDP